MDHKICKCHCSLVVLLEKLTENQDGQLVKPATGVQRLRLLFIVELLRGSSVLNTPRSGTGWA
jgi:hypothetical protein